MIQESRATGEITLMRICFNKQQAEQWIVDNLQATDLQFAEVI